MLDYYILSDDDGELDGILVEEFAFEPDHTTPGLELAFWLREYPRWNSDAPFSLSVRRDPAMRARVRAVVRPEAEAAFRAVSGETMPSEDGLRNAFRSYCQLPVSTPLRLGGEPLHRILLAGDPPDVPALAAALVLVPGSGGPRVTGSGHDGALRWDLRQIGPGLAWCVDLASTPEAQPRERLYWILGVVRRHGLVPVTVERLN